MVAPRVQLHGADRHAVGHQRLHGIGDAGTDRPTGFGAIPVGGPVVRPVRQVRRDRVGVPGPPSAPAREPRRPTARAPLRPRRPRRCRACARSRQGPRRGPRAIPNEASPSATQRSPARADGPTGPTRRSAGRHGPATSPSTGGECRLGAGLKSKSSSGPATTGSANCVNAKPRKSASPATWNETCALGRPNQPVAIPVSALVALNRSRCQPSPTDRSTTTPSGTTSSPIERARRPSLTSSPPHTHTFVPTPQPSNVSTG